MDVPASWAKALRPTMALLGCTSKPVMVASEAGDAQQALRVWIRFVRGMASWRVRIAMTTFFQAGVAGALADAVDGGFHLADAGADGGQCVGDREAEIVVVVGSSSTTFSMPGTRLRTTLVNMRLCPPGRA